MDGNWENFISLNSHEESTFETLPAAATHYEADQWKRTWEKLDFQDAVERDVFPLPRTADREGYYGENHFSYWASGLSDTKDLLDAAQLHDVEIESYLDFGCASGRLIRHFGVQHPDVQTYGCDINRLHVEWCNRFLPSSIKVFQNHSIPTLPLPDNTLSLVSAYSVFTHIEAFETSWLMELRRVLKPGGIAWITVHTDATLKAMDEKWPLYRAVQRHPKRSELLSPSNEFVGDRLVLRYKTDTSYSSNVFYRKEYLERNWSRFFDILDFRHRFPRFQDLIILQKSK
ncbi:MAG: class I SAM-dependent methyltransferase [Henriciella sp.]|nr:class I SAM-dependent methyltransferase [Henriciella sp.]